MPSTSGKKGDRMPNFGAGRQNTVFCEQFLCILLVNTLASLCGLPKR